MIFNLLYSDLPMNIKVGLLILQLFCVVMALTVHEFAHGFIANKLKSLQGYYSVLSKKELELEKTFSNPFYINKD